MKRILIALLLGLTVLASAGCGKSDKEKEAESAAKSGQGTITCEGSAFSGETGLPSDFPKLDGVTFVSSKKTGPTIVVDGYSDESLEGMYHEYKDRFEEVGYTVDFDELEKDRGDSEVAYRAKNATEGIVALRGGDACDNGNVSIHITNRPSD